LRIDNEGAVVAGGKPDIAPGAGEHIKAVGDRLARNLDCGEIILGQSLCAE
jgi:hypothetical protein